MSERTRLPDLVYIGPDKAGSTWLHQVLRWHPEVYAPEVKELFFFDRYHHRGPDWYRSHYAACPADAAVVADVTHDYLFDPAVPARMQVLLGDDVRLMVTLREPVDRAWSAYHFMVRQGRVRESFAEAVRTVPELLDHGRYATHLRPFLAVFGRDQIFTPRFDQLTEAPDRFAADLFAFLGIAPLEVPAELHEKQLRIAQPRSFGVARAARSAGVWVRDRGGERLVARAKGSAFVQRGLYRDFEGEGPTMEGSLREALRAEMAPDVAAVDALLGTSCAAAWGYV
ncbi:MAG TPA: sulfotransferase domain-containing protein [Iamia sp.]